MRINRFPDLAGFCELTHKYNVVPVWIEMLADTETPVSVLEKFYDSPNPIFLLESADGGERWGRYSFLGISAKCQVKVFSERVEFHDAENERQIPHHGEPLEVLKGFLAQYVPAPFTELPRFWGGFVGTEEFIYRDGKPLFHYIGPAISRMVVDYFPVLKNLTVIRTWSGLIAMMSDGIPVLGVTEEVPGFVFATGFSGHGFGLAPIIGRLLSQLIMDCQTEMSISDFCYSRFHKGSDRECACKGNAACTTLTAVCPNKREWLKSI